MTEALVQFCLPFALEDNGASKPDISAWASGTNFLAWNHSPTRRLTKACILPAFWVSIRIPTALSRRMVWISSSILELTRKLVSLQLLDNSRRCCKNILRSNSSISSTPSITTKTWPAMLSIVVRSSTVFLRSRLSSLVAL